MPTLLLVDDDVFNREGIRMYLTSEKYEVREAGDSETAWQLASAGSPGTFDAAVVDISIPSDPRTPSRPGNNHGIPLARRLKSAFPSIGIVLFSAYEDRGNEVFDMVREGTRGLAYKLKGGHPAALLSAIRDVVAGRVVIDPEVNANRHRLADELIKHLTNDERAWVEQAAANLELLTPREREIANRLSASHNTEGIAAALTVSAKTTENYITHVYDKLGLNEMARTAPHLRKVVILAKACMIQDLRQIK
jgi:DNA-binding NarL/FixJ family response regulator